MPLKSKTVRIKKRNSPSLAVHSEDQRRPSVISRSINRWHKAPQLKQHTERKAQYISFSYHGGVIVSARLTVSAIWPATVEMQSEAAAETQTGICCWQVNSNAIHIEARVFSCPLNQSSCSIDGHVKSRARF